MSSLIIVLPYENVDKLCHQWAESERNIDFRRNTVEADRCTSCFAALELKKFLGKRDHESCFSEKEPGEGRFVKLEIDEKESFGGFKISPSGRGLIIAGHDRGGLLNGVYEFLRIQGWRWTEPGVRGEYCPDSSELKWPEKEFEIIPSFKFRGLDAYRESQDSMEYMLWMARNRLNVCFRKAASGKFADKLGMYSRGARMKGLRN